MIMVLLDCKMSWLVLGLTLECDATCHAFAIFFDFDKTLLIHGLTIRNSVLYVKERWTTKCGVRHLRPHRMAIATSGLMRNLLTFRSVKPPRRSIWPEFRQTSPSRLFFKMRCGLYAALSKSGQSFLDGFWEIWKRLGIPVNIQVNNAMSFFGNPTHPRGMGPLIWLCLHYGVEPWFIPMAGPWRNGVIEKFDDQYQQKFLGKVIMTTQDDLTIGTLAFEQRHNSSYRYSKLGGKTPLKALASSKIKLRFPKQEEAPLHRLKKPETGRYNIARLIRSNMKLNIFGELFSVALELAHEYVVATIDFKEQKVKLFLDKPRLMSLITSYIKHRSPRCSGTQHLTVKGVYADSGV